MNIGGSGSIEDNGELLLLHQLADDPTLAGHLVIFDVGANGGDYSSSALNALGRRATLYCFEPSSIAFARLEARFQETPRVHLFRIALADHEGTETLFANTPGSVLASLHHRRLADVEMTPAETVSVRTVDSFCAEHGIDSIQLLKLDIEGSELAALRGAESLITRGAINVIQFEFGGTGIDARVYLRDFFDLLSPRYQIYRLLRDGLVELEYDEHFEIFVYSNYVAVRRDMVVSLLR